MKAVKGYEVKRVNRAIIALVITVVMMVLAAFDVTTMPMAALLATAAPCWRPTASPLSASRTAWKGQPSWSSALPWDWSRR
jgi:hypothetical protein